MTDGAQLSLMIGDGTALLAGFAERSERLQGILIHAGYQRRGGVSAAGLRLVSQVARRDRLRDWPRTQTWADYDALIAAVSAALRPDHP
jgi:hypothetical protein